MEPRGGGALLHFYSSEQKKEDMTAFETVKAEESGAELRPWR